MLGDYLEEKVYLKKQNRFYRLAITLLIVCLLFNGFITYYAIKSEKVVLVPYGLSETVSVSDKDIDNAYLEEFIKFVMYCAFSYTPETVSYQFDRLLSVFTPETYAKYKTTFSEMEKDVLSGNISSSFIVTHIKINKTTRKVLVTGILNQWTRESLVVKNEERKYIIEYDIRHGRLFVKELVMCTGVECNV